MKKSTPPADDQLPSLVRDSLTELREQLAVIARRRKLLEEGSFDPALALAAGQLSRAIIAVSAEQRALERHATKTVQGVTLELVIAWAKGLAPMERGKVRHELEALDRKPRSVLA